MCKKHKIRDFTHLRDHIKEKSEKILKKKEGILLNNFDKVSNVKKIIRKAHSPVFFKWWTKFIPSGKVQKTRPRLDSYRIFTNQHLSQKICKNYLEFFSNVLMYKILLEKFKKLIFSKHFLGACFFVHPVYALLTKYLIHLLYCLWAEYHEVFNIYIYNILLTLKLISLTNYKLI